MRKLFFRLLLFAAFLVPAAFLIAREDNGVIEGEEAYEYVAAAEPVRWYRSNAAGMALEFTPSRLVALRNEYGLSVEIVSPSELPGILLPYHDAAYRVELRILFKAGQESRRQWIFRDSRNFAKLVASGSACFFGVERAAEDDEEESRTGFIEFMNHDGSVFRERVFESDLSQWEFRFFFDGNILRSAETWFKRPPFSPAGYEYPYEAEAPEEVIPVFVHVFTDFYRYSRTGALRAIDRIFHREAGDETDRLLFPRLGPAAAFARGGGTMAVFYIPSFILNAINIEGARVSYSLDSRGRLLSQVWRDDEDRIVGEFLNTWSGDRLVSVLWRTDYDERLVEYEYDYDGNRMVERNIRRGVLERKVTSQDGKDIEEIFMGERLVLRAVWENGLKISEERISHVGRGGPQ